MQLKKVLEKPDLEVVRFDMKDVITSSPGSLSSITTNGKFDFTSMIKGEITNI